MTGGRTIGPKRQRHTTHKVYEAVKVIDCPVTVKLREREEESGGE